MAGKSQWNVLLIAGTSQQNNNKLKQMYIHAFTHRWIFLFSLSYLITFVSLCFRLSLRGTVEKKIVPARMSAASREEEAQNVRYWLFFEKMFFVEDHVWILVVRSIANENDWYSNIIKEIYWTNWRT